MPRQPHSAKSRTPKRRRKLLLETCEERILCNAAPAGGVDKIVLPNADPTAPALAAIAAAPQPEGAGAGGDTADVSADAGAADAGAVELTDEQRAAIGDVVRQSTNEIWFEANVGQFPEGVQYGFKTRFGAMLVYEDHLRLIANQVDPETGEVGVQVVDISFTGANAGWQIVPGGASGVIGSYQQADGSALVPDIFKELTLLNVYDGVDLRLYSAESATLEFDWIVARAADYEKIRLNFTGQDGITYAEDGSATLDLRFQDLTLKMPEVYQVVNGEKHLLDAAMVAAESEGEMRYRISSDLVADAPLVIDPNVVWATYFDLNDSALPFDSYLFAVQVNSNGTYASGWVREIITNGSFGGYMQVNAGFSQGTAINQTYIYRLSNDGLNITAWTSTGIVSPTGGVSNQKLDNMPADLELFPDGRVLLGVSSGVIQIYSANLASQLFNAEPVTMDTLNAVAIVSDDVFYVGGRVTAAIPTAQIPAANIGPDATFAGTQEGVVIRFGSASTTPTATWATYVGGSANEYFTSVNVTPDKTKIVFATSTDSTAGFPALVNAVDSTVAGTELLVGVLNEQATVPAAFDVLSFLGGSGNEGTTGTDTMAALVEATNTHFYVAGTTASTDLPGTAGGAQAANGGGTFDAFISRIPLNGSAGSGFQSTYLGGSAQDRIGGIAIDTRANRMLVFGTTGGGTFPVLNTTPASNYFDGTFGGGTWDIYVATFTLDLATKDFATYIGGSANDYLGQTGELIGQGHVVYSDATGLTYLATTVHSADIPTNVIGTAANSPPGKDGSKSNGSNDTHIIFAFNINIFDYGDAPASYENGSPAREAQSTNLRIGATVDTEAMQSSSVNADGDDTLTTDDEDGISSLTNIAVGAQTSYSTTVSVFNNTGATRTLQAWIDFDRDGLFELGEFASVSVPTNAAQQNVTLTWAALPALVTGQTYLRLRLSDNTLTDNAGTANVDERSIGTGNFGEVEDYTLIISQSSLAGTVYRDLNNDGAINGGETGIQNVTVTLTGTNDLGQPVNVSVLTDANGNYIFNNIRPSNAAGYTITETQPAGFLDGIDAAGTAGGTATNPPPGDAITGVVIGTNVNATGYIFGELPPSSLSGTVYRDLNNDGAINSGETGIQNVTVTLTGTNDIGQVINTSVLTDASGNYSFANLRPGTYTLTETQPAGFLDGRETVGAQASGTVDNTVDSQTISNITLGIGVTGSGNLFGELPPSSLSGSVYGDLDGDGVFDAFETGIPGVTVTLTGTDDRGNAVNTSVTTPASGAYSFTNLRPGSYTITETQPADYTDGLDTQGTPGGGIVNNDQFADIPLLVGVSGADNNFGESPNIGLAKTLQTTSVTGTTGSNLAVGEIATFRLVATIPAGSFTDFQLQDALPDGFQFIDGSAVVGLVSSAGQLTSTTIGPGANMTAIGTPTFAMPDATVSNSPTVNADVYASGTDVFFKLGTLVNSDTSAATTEAVVIEFQAFVVNEVANQAAVNLDNTFSVLFDKDGAGAPDPHGTPSNTVTATVVEPVLGVSKVLNTPGTDAGDAVQYVITITNAAGNNAAAYDINIADLLDPGIALTDVTLGSGIVVSGATVTSNTSTVNNLALVLDTLAAGASATVTLNAVVVASAPAGSTVTNGTTITWTSTPGANANERTGAGGINDYTASATSADFTLARPLVDKLTPASTTYSIGETVTYDILVTLPEGVTQDLAITDVLPAGLDFVSVAVQTAAGGALANTFAGSVPAPVTSNVGNAYTFTFGNTTAANDNNGANNSFLVRVTARVANTLANQNAVTLTNNASLAYNDGTNGASTVNDPTPDVNITVVEPVLTLDKTNVGASTGLDAGDTVQQQIVITNTGTATAHEVTLSDVLPAGVLATAINSTTAGGGATVDTATAIAGGGTSITGEYTIPAGGSITILYTATLQSSVTPNTSYTNTATVTFSSVDGTALGQGTPTGERIGTSPNLQGDGSLNDYRLTDSEQISTGGVLTIGKGVDNSTPSIGDVLTYTVTLTLNEGTTQGIVVTDNLPANGDLQFVAGSAAVSFGTAGSSISGSATPVVSGANNNVLTFTLGDAVIPADAGANTVVLTYQVRVANVTTNQAGDLEINSASVTATNLPTPPPGTTTVTLREPVLTFDKANNAAGTVSAGDNITYTLTITNPGGANASTAFDSLVRDTMPAGILITSITGTTLDGGATVDSAAAITGGGTGLTGQFDIPVGGSVVITYVGTVQVSAPLGSTQTNNAEVTWTSLNGGNSLAPDAGERFGAAGATLGDGSLNDYRLTDSTAVTVGVASFDKQLFSTSDAATAGANVAIAETVTYALVVTMPAGTAPSLSIVDTLPVGLQFLSSSIVTTAAASNGLLAQDFNGTVPAPVVSGGAADGDDVTFTFGAITAAADGNSANNTFLVLVNARVTDIAGNEGILPGQTALDNTATFDIPGDGVPPFTPPPVTVTVIEPVLAIDKEFNVTQADAGDTVQISITVTNTGTGPAHDVVVTDIVDTTKFGSITAVDTPAGFAFSNVAGTVTYTGGSIAAGGSATFTFNVVLLDAVNATETLSNTATATATSQPGTVAGERSFGPVQDTDTLDVPGVLDVTKSIVTPGATVQIGDTITYSVVVRIVEGTTNTLSLVDNIPSNVDYVPGSAIISATDPGVTVNGFAANFAAGVLTMSATSVVNAGNVDNTATTDSGTFTITYQAVVRDIAGNAAGTNIVNNLNATADGGLTDPNNTATTTIIEPALRVVKAVNDASADLGQTLHFTLTISHTAASNATAYDLLVRDALPAGLGGLTGILVNGVAVGASPLVDTNNSTGTLLDLKLSELAVGSTITVEFDATLSTSSAFVGATIDNNARIYWDSQPGESANSVLTGAADGDEDRDYGAGAGIEVFNADTDPAQDTERLTVNGSTLSGVVYHDADASGGFNAGDSGLAGESVTLTGTTIFGEAISITIVTGAGGVYSFSNLAPGTYTLTETQPAGFLDGAETVGTTYGGTVSAALGSDTISTLTIPAGNNSGTGYNFGEVLASSLSGLVYSDTNNDGIRQGGESTLDTTVTLTGTDFLGEVVNVTLGTTAGAYSFANLRPGTYTLTETQVAGFFDGRETVGAQASGTVDNTVDSQTISAIALNQNVNGSGNNFGELAPSSLGGFVYADLDNDGVKDAGETGIPGATVTLTGTDDRGNAITAVVVTTDALGAYNFELLRPGSYTITETQPGGFLDGLDTQGTPGGGIVNNDQFADIPLTLAGTAGAENNFGELRPATIEGFVYDDLDNDGIRDAGEAGIGGVDIRLVGTDDLGAAVDVTVQTLGDGTYSFTGVRPGTYTVIEVAQPAGFLDGRETAGNFGGSTAVNEQIGTFILPPNQNAVDYNFGELTPSSLSGFVYDDRNNNGLRDDGLTGIGGVPVTLTGTDDLGATVNTTISTNADGSYSFGNLRPGTYTITETQPLSHLDGLDTIGTPGGNATVNDVFSGIVLAAAVNGAENNFGELTPSSISGTVYRDFNNDGLVTPGETFIGGVEILLTGTDDLGAPVSATAFTDGSGNYTFTNLRPGNYTVSEVAQPAGLLDGRDTAGTGAGGAGGPIGTDAISGLVLASNTLAENYNFGELNPASLSGTVFADYNNNGLLDGAEAGIPGVTITLTGTDDLGAIVPLVATTDANGNYTFTDLRPGTYAINESQPAGYADGIDTVGTGLVAPNVPGDSAVNDILGGITFATVAPGNNAGTGYNFAEQPQFTLDKTIVGTSESGTPGSSVAVGETVRYRLVVTIPTGTLSNVQLQDLIPAGMQFAGNAKVGLVGALASDTITAPLAGIGDTPTVDLADAQISDNATTNNDAYASGTDVFFKLGNLTNLDTNGATTEAIVIEFDALVVNELANDAGVTLTNDFRLLHERDTNPGPDPTPDVPPVPPVVTITEPVLTFDKAANPLTGLEAGSLVTYTLTITNPGGAFGGTAFDSLVSDAMPAGILITSIDSTTLLGGATADSAAAITGGGTSLTGQFDIPAGASVIITYTGTLQVSVAPGSSLTNNAELTWTSINGGNSLAPDTGERFGAPGSLLGDGSLNDYRLVDSETVTVATGTYDKQLFATSDGGTIGTDVAVGELVTYALVVTLPQGTTSDFTITDFIPAGMQFVSSSVVTSAASSNGFLIADFGGSLSAPGVVGGAADGDDVTFTFASPIVVAADGDTTNNTFLVLVTTRVTDVAGNTGLAPQTTLGNTATFDIPTDGEPPFTPPPVTVTVVEPDLSITKNFDVASADASDTVTITITVTNNGTAPAYDVALTDPLDLARYGNITPVSAPAGFVFDSTGNNVSYTGGTIAAGETASFVFTAQLTGAVNATETLTNTATVTATSQPGTPPDDRSYGPLNATDTLDIPGVLDVTKTLTFPGSGNVQFGDIVVYTITVRTIEGTTNNLQMQDILPAGLQYVPGSAVISGADPGVVINGFNANAAGQILTITATSIVNSGDVDSTAIDADGFTITYEAIVQDLAVLGAGDTLVNTLDAIADGGLTDPGNTATATLVEPQLQITKTADDTTPDLGQTIHYTLTIQHTGNSATAYDLLVHDALPSGLTLLTGSITVNGANLDANNSTASLLNIKLDQLAINDIVTIEFDAIVGTSAALAGQTLDNNARLYWDTQAGESQNSIFTGTPDGDEDRDYGANTGAEPFDQDTDPAQDTERVTINASSISGVVYHDVNANGVFDSGTDSPLVNEAVTLTGTTAFGEAFTVTVNTGAGGVYTFINLAPGTYDLIQAQPAGYIDGAETVGTPFGGTKDDAFGSNAITGLNVPGGSNSGDGYNFGEVLGSSISGLVYNDQDVSGDLSAGDTGVDGVTVTLTGTDFLGQSVSQTLITGGGGLYTFDTGGLGLRPGTYTITETQPAGLLDRQDTAGTAGGDALSVNDQISGIVLDQGTAATGYLFGEETPKSISGTVFTDFDKDGVLDAGTDTGIGGVLITLTGTDLLGNPVTRTVTTNPDGTYQMDNIAAGSYTLSETQPLGYGSSTPNDIPLTITTLDVNGLDFGETLGSISGLVFRDNLANGIFDGTDAGLNGVTVTLIGTDVLGNSVNLTTTTAGGGIYSFGNLLGGNYRIVESQPAGYLDGADIIGTAGGINIAPDVISGILLDGGEDATDYQFAEIFDFAPLKTIVSTSNPGTQGTNVSIGEVIRYRLVVTLPEGSMDDFVLEEFLPNGLVFLNDGKARVGFVSSNGINIFSSTLGSVPGMSSLGSPSFVLPDTAVSASLTADVDNYRSGTNVYFKLGDVLNSDPSQGSTDPDYIVIEFNARVVNEPASQLGRPLDNSFRVRFDLTGDGVSEPVPLGGESSVLRARVAEPVLALDKKLTAGSATPVVGDRLTFTVTITHTADSNATAWEAIFADQLPKGLEIISITTQADGGAAVTVAATANNTGGISGQFDIPVGGKITITYQVRVTSAAVNGATLVNAADITWTSMPGDDPTERASGDSLLDQGGLNDYELTAQAKITVSNPPGDTPFVYFYDRFNEWSQKEIQRVGLGFVDVSKPDIYRPPILPLAPMYAGEADPGSLLTLTLYNANGDVIGEQTVVVDAGGNWMASFRSTVIRDFPNTVRISQINQLYTAGSLIGHNLRAYYSPALNPGHFFFANLLSTEAGGDAPLLQGLGLTNPLSLSEVKYGGELLSVQAAAGGY